MADKMDNPRVNPLRQDGRAPSLAYNSALDGLRGVAILLVILSHAHAPLFDGAFYGVDLFFVLSGFLITSLLLQELQSNGRLDYWRFYRRRFFRLMPALALFLVTSLFGLKTGSRYWFPTQSLEETAAASNGNLKN